VSNRAGLVRLALCLLCREGGLLMVVKNCMVGDFVDVCW